MKKSNEEKRVVIYCRESRDDYGENYERIETQRDLLVKYCKSHGYTNIVDIIMDDDKSGTDFSRFDDIRERARKKEIDVIVFKNSARLGRNQKEALDFVEYLEQKGVEIIFEDEQYNEEMFGLYAWFNERRARDDSKNIRRNLRHKIEEGDLLVKAIYGYNKDGKQLIVNEETAPVVQEIFELYSKDWGYQKIATYLNKKGIPTPSQSRGFANAKQTANWKAQHIVRILDDRRYIGDYVGGHTEKLSFKSKKTRVKDQAEWTIIENHHEPIIDKVLFEKVQKIRMKRKKESDKYNNGFKFVDVENNLYSGLLYCGRCGTPMYKRKGTSGTRKRPDSYLCKKYCNEGAIKEDVRKDYGCKSHRIRIEHLDQIVNAYIDNLISNPEFKSFVMDNVKAISTNKVTLEKELNKSRQTLEKLEKQFKQVYEDKLNDLIPEFIYKDKKQELEKNIKYEKEKLQEIETKFNTLNKLEDKEDLIFKAIEDIKKNGLRKEELSRLFDKIIIFDKNEITKEEKDLYNLNDMMYNELYENGGLAFHLKFMYPQNITIRGCDIGSRPIDLHLKAFKKLGINISEEYGFIECKCDRIVGTNIDLDFPSVGATENIILASTFAEGKTTITNAAKEPEIVDLANMLNKMGAKILGAGTNIIEITGITKLKNISYRIIPDRIEAGTILCAAAITGGNVKVTNVIPEHITAVLAKLEEAGCKLKINRREVELQAPKRLQAVEIKTMPYPGFPTDLQSIFGSILSTAKGTSIITENIFESRFKYASELTRMGAKNKIEGKTLIIYGTKKITGANVNSTDLRGGAALVLAALVARGKTKVCNINYILRGYENLDEKLTKLGANIREEGD